MFCSSLFDSFMHGKIPVITESFISRANLFLTPCVCVCGGGWVGVCVWVGGWVCVWVGGCANLDL